MYVLTLNVTLALAALTALALFAMTVRRVPEGQAWTVHRFGRYVRTLQPGRHAVWPVVDRIAQHVPLTGHHIELPTRELGGDRTSADLYYQILDPLQTGDGLETVDEMVLHQAADALSSVAREPQRSQDGPAGMAEALKIELNRRLGSKGLRVIRCALHANA